MAWDEWEQLKADALGRQQGGSAHMQLNQLDGGGPVRAPSQYGDLKVQNDALTKVGKDAHTLYNQLWDKARVHIVSSDGAAGNLSKQGFALGAGLKHVSTRWDEQLKSLMDACAQISNHMQVTKKTHDGDEGYILRQMSSIATLDAGFDERVGPPGKHNEIYGEQSKEKKKD
ncbi:hypothetical protein G3I32_33155 [Streptomyces coelicoflavus]|uniref:AG1 protein n=1 Tax=Streptomyces coelicoflavus TaxID=285562 RepID=A0A7K3PUM6_9ACTN|nr:hypothetical protein [Streptomyces coelicoflavus]NEB13633.1 hypothetical protein [Streptomyces coelicoflavus]